MIQYTNDRFVCDGRISLMLPDDVFLDFNPPVIPNEGMIFYSPDLKVTIDVELIETAQEARSFLLEASGGYGLCPSSESHSEPLRAPRRAWMTYEFSLEIYEEYVLTVPSETPALFDVCLTQRIENPTD